MIEAEFCKSATGMKLDWWIVGLVSGFRQGGEDVVLLEICLKDNATAGEIGESCDEFNRIAGGGRTLQRIREMKDKKVDYAGIASD